MSGICGIDIGTTDAVVSFINKGVVDIVRNEVSERKTPCVVAFTESKRLIGELAMASIKSNLSNTCRNPKQMLGPKIATAPEKKAQEEFFQGCQIVTNDQGQVCYRVNYKNEGKVFTPVEVLAMLITKLSKTTENFTGAPIKDAVVSCPPFFDDFQRQALIDAGKVAGVNVLRVMNDTLATSLSYGIYRSNEFEESKDFNVLFVSAGHSHFSATLTCFSRGKCKVLNEVFSEELGGRNVDKLLMEILNDEFLKKNKMNILENKKARYKLEEAVFKGRKTLSANKEVRISVENILDGHDISSVLTREILEEACQKMGEKMKELLTSVFLPDLELHSVEIVGGFSRTPFVRQAILDVITPMGLSISQTLNADESVARGCALQAAILSPLFKVRNFDLIDQIQRSISVEWHSNENSNELKTAELFQAKTSSNVMKSLTFYRNKNFDIYAKYTATGVLLGHYQILLPQNLAENDQQKIKVKAKLDHNGLFDIDQAELIKEEIVIEMVKEKVPKAKEVTEDTAGVGAGEVKAEDEAKMEDTQQPEQQVEYEEIEVPREKKKTTTLPLEILKMNRPGLSDDKVALLNSQEIQFRLNDKEIEEAEQSRNDLESFLYDFKEKMNTIYKDFRSEEEKSAIEETFQKAQFWLDDNFDNLSTANFVEKLEEVRKIPKQIMDRNKAHHDAIEAAEEAKRKAIEEAEKKIEEEKRKAEQETKMTEDRTEPEDEGMTNEGRQSEEI